VTVLTTELTGFFWRVLTLRDHVWHQRDFSKTFAAIRHADDRVGRPPEGTRLDSWGQGTRNVVPTGPGYVLNVKATIEEQAAWLARLDPGYVLAYPSALAGIADVFEERGWRLSQLDEATTFGEVLEGECRAKCERVFGKKVVDLYSSEEVGYIALQCPAGDRYHVQAENLVVEILDDEGQACRAGQIGRVVVTTLHNFAMPLVRYDIGDYAEVGTTCGCGRGLPVLTRILGRQRNLLVMPDGQRRWPVFTDSAALDGLPPFFQFQVVQRTLDTLEVNVVRPTESITPEEEALVARHMQRVLGYPFKIEVRTVREIARSPRGKFEDFVSLVE
jgi:phenylacetate-CoA ligase